MELILAPLRGHTDLVFRQVWSRFFEGFDRAMAPFVPTIRNERVPDRLLRELDPAENRALPVEPQLLGNRPEDFLAMARRLFDWGYPSVNWNLGCPFPMVAKKGRGSGLLPTPDRIEAFLDRVVPNFPGKLSIKTRLGRYSADEMDGFLPVCNRYPLAEMTVHPRVSTQMYEGEPDLDGFARFLAESAHPVVYSGDIRTPESLDRLRERFPGVAGWMVGRGAVADPFLASRLRGRPVPADAAARFRAFHDALMAAYGQRLEGPGHLLGRMKAFWTYFGPSLVGGRKLMKRVHRSGRLEAAQNHVNRFFSGDPIWRGSSEEVRQWR
ncbi:MAG: tRNA dihydrouridine synthase [Desulfococcaceae bacterium]